MAPPFGWTIDGGLLFVLAVLLVPWALLGLAAGGEFFQRYSRTRVRETLPAPTLLGEAA